MTKENLKNKAIQLRKKGKSYSEILEKVSVARSTLSLWLRLVNLSKRQKQNLTLKKLQAAWWGGEVKKLDRIERSKKIIEQAKMEIKKITNKDLWLLGIMLYWAEGSKEKNIVLEQELFSVIQTYVWLIFILNGLKIVY